MGLWSLHGENQTNNRKKFVGVLTNYLVILVRSNIKILKCYKFGVYIPFFRGANIAALLFISRWAYLFHVGST